VKAGQDITADRILGKTVSAGDLITLPVILKRSGFLPYGFDTA
jgi:hypothetical protein